MDSANRVALVTGGKRIGAVVAIELARKGADIALCYNRSRAEADQTAAAIKGLEPACLREAGQPHEGRRTARRS